MPQLDQLVTEANRQLNICNACRYCEGYCAVFPALERRTTLGIADLAQLANLCHDCRDCYYACMYIPPHEFAVNPPRLLSEIRQVTYNDWVGPKLPLLGLFGKSGGVGVAAAFVGLVLLALVAGTDGLGALLRTAHSASSPYTVISYPALLAVALVVVGWSVFVTAHAGARYWKMVHGRLRDLLTGFTLLRTAGHAGSLKYLGGGGAGCSYPRESSGPLRKGFHQALAYGFLFCLASTVSAGILQDILGSPPPYRLVSAPVILGVIGGIGMLIGCAGLIYLKRLADPDPSDPAMAIRDLSLLFGLISLAATGLLVLLLRDTAAFGIVLVVHLCTVLTCFLLAPYSKFIHGLFRFLAIFQDNLESRSEERILPR